MRTPILDFVRKYRERNISRLHMPGHKGQGPLGFEELDITEIRGADVLYSPEGIILESENNASSLFGSAHSFYSAEGSTLCIKAMLRMVSEESRGGERPLILAARNAHRAFISAAALLDLDVKWLYPRVTDSLCSCPIEACDVERAISESDILPSGVYLTSPDYLGGVADIKGISEVCHKYGVPLIVDNAHGAYLKFLDVSEHPMDLGADICCDSAHKTLPVLTGGAYLHVSRSAEEKYLFGARRALSLFASTSPSYLILQSLDVCNAYLSGEYREELARTVRRVERLKERAFELGFFVVASEPLKIVFRARDVGYSGDDFADKLREMNIEPEFSDRDFTVLMVTPQNTEADLERIEKALCHIEIKEAFHGEKISVPRGKAVMSLREAVLSRSEAVSVEDAVGRICGDVCVSCPPAVPIAVSGELITRETAELLKYYGVREISVIRS